MSIQFCSRCGAELATQRDAGRRRLICPRCGFIHYRNPIPVALAVASRQDEILLIRRREEPLRGFWAPPSGYVEWDETAEEAAVRETREETGLEIRLEGLLGVYSRADTGILFVAYWAEIIGGEARASDDAGAAGFFAPNSRPSQPGMHRGSLLDAWFLQVIEEVIAKTVRKLSMERAREYER